MHHYWSYCCCVFGCVIFQLSLHHHIFDVPSFQNLKHTHTHTPTKSPDDDYLNFLRPQPIEFEEPVTEEAYKPTSNGKAPLHDQPTRVSSRMKKRRKFTLCEESLEGEFGVEQGDVSSDQLYVKFDDSTTTTTTTTATSSSDTSDISSSSSSTNTHIATLSESDVIKNDDGTNDNRSCQGNHEDECKVNERSKTAAVKPVPIETKSKLSFNEPVVKDLEGFKQYLLREGVEVIVGFFFFF
jgi:hypothetical protein